MENLLLVSLVLLFLPTTECKVKYHFSEVYDQFDLLNTPTIQLSLCTEGCTIYASISRNYVGDPEKIVIFDNTKNITEISLKDLARNADDSGNKVRVGLEGNYSIKNTNPNLSSSGLVIYVTAAKFFATDNPLPPVYEASLYKVTNPPNSNTITLMSADPYTLLQVNQPRGKQVTIVAAGSDVLNAVKPDPCARLYEGTDASSLYAVPVRTPLITLNFETRDFTIRLQSGEPANQIFLKNNQQTTVMSAGYHGCTDKNRFRYKMTSNGLSTSVLTNLDQPLYFKFKGDLHTATDDAISLKDSNGIDYYLGGDSSDAGTVSNFPSYGTYVIMAWNDIHNSGTFAFQITTSDNLLPSANATTHTPPETTTKNALKALLSWLLLLTPFLFGFIHS